MKKYMVSGKGLVLAGLVTMVAWPASAWSAPPKPMLARTPAALAPFLPRCGPLAVTQAQVLPSLGGLPPYAGSILPNQCSDCFSPLGGDPCSVACKFRRQMVSGVTVSSLPYYGVLGVSDPLGYALAYGLRDGMAQAIALGNEPAATFGPRSYLRIKWVGGWVRDFDTGNQVHGGDVFQYDPDTGVERPIGMVREDREFQGNAVITIRTITPRRGPEKKTKTVFDLNDKGLPRIVQYNWVNGQWVQGSWAERTQ
jgi:hypothetical protein